VRRCWHEREDLTDAMSLLLDSMESAREALSALRPD
jgi:hypothetical protein